MEHQEASSEFICIDDQLIEPPGGFGRTASR